MDYTKINTWEIFIEHFDRISRDHEKNIQNTKNRIQCINCLLINEPKLKVQSGKDEFITQEEFDPTPVGEYLSLMPQYCNRYKEIMMHYIEYNNDLVIEKKEHLQIEMYWDIEKTEHFESVDAAERERLLRFHDKRGIEIQEDLIARMKKEGF